MTAPTQAQTSANAKMSLFVFIFLPPVALFTE